MDEEKCMHYFYLFNKGGAKIEERLWGPIEFPAPNTRYSGRKTRFVDDKTVRGNLNRRMSLQSFPTVMKTVIRE